MSRRVQGHLKKSFSFTTGWESLILDEFLGDKIFYLLLRSGSSTDMFWLAFIGFIIDF